MIISVNGEQRVRIAPERGQLSFTVQAEAATREACVAAVTESAGAIRRELGDRLGRGVAERPVVQPVRIHSWREEQRRSERFVAQVDFRVTFTDLDALAAYTEHLTSVPGVAVGGIWWSLTDETADRLRDECIAGAVERARRRAEAMARAAGAGPIEIVEIADPGILGGGESGGGIQPMSRALASAAPGVSIEPEDIEIGASLQLRFATLGS